MTQEDGNRRNLRIQLGAGIRFADADGTLDAFEALLTSKTISIAPGSPLERILLFITEFLFLQRKELSLTARPTSETTGYGCLDSLTSPPRLSELARRDSMIDLFPHLRLLAGTTVDPSQNAATDREDQSNHKLFELLVGAAVATFADDLEVENPRGSSTTTPDLTVRLGGIRWGIPCKVLHSVSTSTYRDRVVEAIAKIDRADVDRGLVLINAKHLVPIDELLPFGKKSASEPYEVHETAESASEHIDSFRRRMVTRLGDEVSDIVDAFRRSSELPRCRTLRITFPAC